MAEPLEAPREELVHEDPPVKGSRFLALVAPAASAAEAEARLARVRAEHKSATHHCWAWRLGAEGQRFRSSDDGEPSGSAGRPILAQIEGHRMTELLVVVVRWFGGTKLGVGGLVRAYGGCAGHALDRVPRRRVIVTERLRLVAPYACGGALQAVLAARGLQPAAASYAAEVRLELEVPRDERAAIEAELRERTAGLVRIEALGPEG